MLEELAPRCHLSALVKRPKRKFSSSPQVFKVAYILGQAALKSCVFARHLLFIRCHDFRTAPTFFHQLLLRGHDTKNEAGALS